jgi:hypothetical protein
VETCFTAGLAACFAACYWLLFKGRMTAQVFIALLFVLYVVDVWRVDNKFLFTIKVPEMYKTSKNPVMEFIGRTSNQYRVLPMNGEDPMGYVNQNIPVMYTSNAVQQVRWQQVIDSFNISGPMMDMLNVKYLVMAKDDFQTEKNMLENKFTPVFYAPDGTTVVLENKYVLPKAWIVPSVAVVTDSAQRLALLQNAVISPYSVALVEAQPKLAMPNPTGVLPPLSQNVTVPLYEGEHIVVNAVTPVNALLVIGEKYYKGWEATIDGKATEIVPVNHILRGVYLTPGSHKIEFRFDPLPFKIGKYLTLGSFAFFAMMLVREWFLRRSREGLGGNA